MPDPYENNRGWWTEAIGNILSSGEHVEFELGGWSVSVSPKSVARGTASFSKLGKTFDFPFGTPERLLEILIYHVEHCDRRDERTNAEDVTVMLSDALDEYY